MRKRTFLAKAWSTLPLCLAPWMLYAQSFFQDFESSVVVSDYIGSEPDQFAAIATSGGGMTVSISGGALQFDRGSGNAGIFLLDDRGASVRMILSFDLSAWGVGTNTTSAAILRIGSGYDAGYFAPSNTQTFARIGINLLSQPVEGFQLRDISTGENSLVFQGRQQVHWVLNPDSISWTYWGPDGMERILGPFQGDVWVGQDLVFGSMDALSLVPPEDIKLNFPQGLGTIRFDNIRLEGSPQVLPLVFLSAGCDHSGAMPSVRWTVGGEDLDTEHFLLEGTGPGRGVDTVGQVAYQTGKEAYEFRLPAGAFGCPEYYRIRAVGSAGGIGIHTRWLPACCPADDGAPFPYPVPARKRISIGFGEADGPAPPCEATLLHGSGRVVVRRTVNRGDADISLEGVPPGMYILILQNGQGQRWTYPVPVQP